MFIQDMKSLFFQTAAPTLFTYMVNHPKAIAITGGYFAQFIPTDGISYTAALATTNAVFAICINKNDYIKKHASLRRTSYLIFFCASTITYTNCAKKLGIGMIAIEKAYKLAMVTLFVQSFIRYLERHPETKVNSQQTTQMIQTHVVSTLETTTAEESEIKPKEIVPTTSLKLETETETTTYDETSLAAPDAPPLTPEKDLLKISTFVKEEDSETTEVVGPSKIKRDVKRAYFHGALSLGRLYKNRELLDPEEEQTEETDFEVSSPKASTTIKDIPSEKSQSVKSIPSTSDFLSLSRQKLSQHLTELKPKEEVEEIWEWET